MRKNISVKKVKHFITWWTIYWRWEILYRLFYQRIAIDKKKICVISWKGKYFNCNPAAIASYVSNNNSFGLKIIAVVENPSLYKNDYPNIKFVKVKSIGHLIAQLSCKVFIANVRMPEFEKKTGQIYIQTWHGMGPKKSEKDSCDALTEKYIKNAIKDCEQTDIMLSGSKWQTEWIKNSTWYKGKILEVGTPRDDCFFNKEEYEEKKKNVYETYQINKKTKIVLFAPTFRSAGEIAQNSIDINALLNAFSEKFGSDFVLLLRLHPNVAKQPLPEIYAKYLSTKVFNATLYPNMQELLCASDILITDFSSVSTEFVMQDKPCFLYIPDYNTYDRGLYFRPEEMPFPFSFDEKSLISSIQIFNLSDYKKRNFEYKRQIGMCEIGNSCNETYHYLQKYIGW